MTHAYTTCGIYDFWTLLERTLNGVAWPANASNPDGMSVWFGDSDQMGTDSAADTVGVALERAVIAPMVNSPSQEWGPTGSTLPREEKFECLVYIITAVPGTDAIHARTRLEQLTSEVELAVRAINATRPAGSVPTELAKYKVWSIEVAQVLPILVSDFGGYTGKAEILVRCNVRVGQPPLV